MNTQSKQKPTVVLVHAAWADGSSWINVILQLQRLGFPVVSAQIPLTSLADDALAVRRVLSRVSGPIVLAAHSYGGAPMSAAATGQHNVRALVFVAGITPDEGETVGELFHRAEPHPKAPQLVPDDNNFIWMSAEGFANAIAHEAAPEDIALLTATQKPISLKCLGEPITKPAWSEKPSWYLVAEKDRMISPATQRYMAVRMKAHIDSQPVDHTPLVSAPESVVRLIVEAVDGTA